MNYLSKTIILLSTICVFSCSDSVERNPELIKNVESLREGWFKSILSDTGVDIKNIKKIETNSQRANPILDKQSFDLLAKELNQLKGAETQTPDLPEILKDQLKKLKGYYGQYLDNKFSLSILESKNIKFLIPDEEGCRILNSYNCLIVKTTNSQYIISGLFNTESCASAGISVDPNDSRRIIVNKKAVADCEKRGESYNSKLKKLILAKKEEFKNRPNYTNMELLKKDLSQKNFEK